MTRFVFFDHIYPDAWRALPHSTMDDWFNQSFGTSNFWELALKAAGHEAKTLVMNAYPTMCEMISDAKAFEPDVVVSMEVGRFHYETLRDNFPNAKTVAFCSHHAIAPNLHGWDMVFSSFKWMPEHCAVMNQPCEYLPLAFGKPVLKRLQKSCTRCGGYGITDDPLEGRGRPVGNTIPCTKCNPRFSIRDIPVTFIGGLGMRTWKSGTETMAAIAEAVPEFKWWGYCQGAMMDMPMSLQKAYRGEAWGKTYYELLMRTLVVVNRHGEIAQKHSNNCRVFESQGCGALLLNDCDGIPGADGIVYDNAEDAVRWIRSCIEYPEVTIRSAARAQERILAEHTFEARVPRFLEVIEQL